METLSRRFAYGKWDEASTLINEVEYGIPRRQRELIDLSQRQLKAQRQAAQDISRSNIEAADIIAGEISRQTEELGDLISQVGGNIVSAIDQFCDRLCIELVEIRWELAQITDKLDQMLYVLRNSRNNEARQLVEQGVRHYLIEEYPEAESRFLRALDFDTTDYQVLMNIAFIEVHKENAR